MTTITSRIDFVSFNDLVNWSVRYLRENRSRYKNTFSLVRIGDFLTRNRNIIEIQDDILYTRVTIRLYTKGVLKRDEEWGRNIGTKRQFIVAPGQFIMSKIDARNGAFGLVPPELDGAVTTADFLSYDVDTSRINPAFLTLVSSTKEFLAICQSSSSGTTGRQRVDETQFLNIKIPLPSLSEQNRIVAAYNARIAEAERLEEQAKQLERKIEEYLFNELGIVEVSLVPNSGRLAFVNWRTVNTWGVDKLLRGGNKDILRSNLFPNRRLAELAHINPHTDFKSLLDNFPISFLPMECISDEYGEIEEFRTGIKAHSKGYTKFQEGDLLWAKITPCMENGKSALANNLLNGYGYGSTEYHVIRSQSPSFRISFLYHLLRAKAIRKDAVNYFSGTAGQQRVPKFYLEGLIVPHPPLEKQIEIETRITYYKSELKKLRVFSRKEHQQAIEDFESELFSS
ncbi:restriction endonuclease subunit S [Spirosoma montaniterrae]|uniref:Type I restriction modification DNA specificity domain-containing protein n=1 Tax=Spirosoma montaniterrae TaxID=1178516 RepID=A0A1P9X0T5_9BACT|nr:restriction endonuclease subunit S [Spirosoma montaniterrae]AQG81208.1 hypothetical protein AWR27_18910 [Spirosoma montaniterrae]